MKRHAVFLTKVLASNIGVARPYKLNFALTYKCNHHCLNCNIWKTKPKSELTKGEIDIFFKNNSFSWITLTGGELFLRSDIEDILKSVIIHNKNLYVLTLTTNGLLSKRIVPIVKNLSKSPIPFIMVTISLDGISEVHDRIRGIKGAFKQAVQTYIELKKIPRIKAQIGYTIFPENAGKFPEFINYMKKKFPEFSVNQMHINTYNTSEVYYGDNIEKEQKVTVRYTDLACKDLLYFLSLYKKRVSYESLGERIFQKLNLDYLQTKQMPLPCRSLATSVFLDPMGNIYPCIMWNKNLGNIRNNQYKLYNLYESSLYKELIAVIKQKKCPNCWTVCEGTQTMLGHLLNSRFLQYVI